MKKASRDGRGWETSNVATARGSTQRRTGIVRVPQLVRRLRASNELRTTNRRTSGVRRTTGSPSLGRLCRTSMMVEDAPSSVVLALPGPLASQRQDGRRGLRRLVPAGPLSGPGLAPSVLNRYLPPDGSVGSQRHPMAWGFLNLFLGGQMYANPEPGW